MKYFSHTTFAKVAAVEQKRTSPIVVVVREAASIVIRNATPSIVVGDGAAAIVVVIGVATAAIVAVVGDASGGCRHGGRIDGGLVHVEEQRDTCHDRAIAHLSCDNQRLCTQDMLGQNVTDKHCC